MLLGNLGHLLKDFQYLGSNCGFLTSLLLASSALLDLAVEVVDLLVGQLNLLGDAVNTIVAAFHSLLEELHGEVGVLEGLPAVLPQVRVLSLAVIAVGDVCACCFEGLLDLGDVLLEQLQGRTHLVLSADAGLFQLGFGGAKTERGR